MSTIRAFSQRLLPPFSGQVQIAVFERVRALTMDGRRWEIQFQRSVDPEEQREQARHNRPIRPSFMRVAMIEDGEISRLSLPGFLDSRSIDEQMRQLSEFIAASRLPFPAADHLEYWLLDARDEAPLALIHACTAHEEIPTYPSRTEWTALPASVMPIEKANADPKVYTAPVNFRFERVVAERAGQRPRARWFNRQRVEDQDFPPCLVNEHWDDDEAEELCRLYISRQAPRLLMLHGLRHEDRRRLEMAAKAHPLEVARFYPLYPEIADPELMERIRVEARLRLAAGG